MYNLNFKGNKISEVLFKSFFLLYYILFYAYIFLNKNHLIRLQKMGLFGLGEKENIGVKVGDVMTRNFVSIKPDASLIYFWF